MTSKDTNKMWGFGTWIYLSMELGLLMCQRYCIAIIAERRQETMQCLPTTDANKDLPHLSL